MSTKKELRRNRIKLGIRNKIAGTADRPRLAVFRSNKQIYAQIIDDINGVTLASASSLKSKTTSGLDQAKEVGVLIAKMAQTKGVGSVKFDRGGYLYHGRVKALAEAAREGGLNF
jgi:large subunit ribosomal protein L18